MDKQALLHIHKKLETLVDNLDDAIHDQDGPMLWANKVGTHENEDGVQPIYSVNTDSEYLSGCIDIVGKQGVETLAGWLQSHIHWLQGEV